MRLLPGSQVIPHPGIRVCIAFPWMYCLAVPHANVPSYSFLSGSSCLRILPVRGLGGHTIRERMADAVAHRQVWWRVLCGAADGGRWLRVCVGGSLQKPVGQRQLCPCLLPAFRPQSLLDACAMPQVCCKLGDSLHNFSVLASLIGS